MLAFACPTCELLVVFESARCLNCATELVYDHQARAMAATAPGAPRCANAQIAGCNWRAPATGALCAACELTRTRPADADADALGGLRVAEAAKRRLIFELHDLGLPVCGWQEHAGGLGFDFLSSEQEKITTGHADGIVTLDLDETDPARREQMRVRLDEPYRTVLGHLRHEIGHYYEPILIPEGSFAQDAARALFGDERIDYQQALEHHYQHGPPANWEQSFVSAYATMHPWEDWAETFAHYLHIRDTLQSAAAYGLRTDGPSIRTADAAPLSATPAETSAGVRAMLDVWLPMTYALNAVSRSMGAPDLYPFLLTAEIEAKLGFIDARVREPHS